MRGLLERSGSSRGALDDQPTRKRGQPAEIACDSERSWDRRPISSPPHPPPLTDRRAAGTPQAFRYQDDIVTPSEEQALVAEITTLDLKPFEFRGYLGLRRVRAFGYRYDYVREGRGRRGADPRIFAGADRQGGRRCGPFQPRPSAKCWSPNMRQGRRSDGIGTSRSSATSSASHCCRRASSACGRRNGARWDRASQILEPRSAYKMTGEDAP